LRLKINQISLSSISLLLFRRYKSVSLYENVRTMTFTAIDFETAHACFPCQIGLTHVENGQITESASWLIKPACFPYMNPHNERVHSISSFDLKDAPTFEELWSELHFRLEDSILVAHNAAFDIGVLRSVLQYYDLAKPWTEYFCSLGLSRKVWKGLPNGHSLGNLCAHHNIHFRHHDAGDDAAACAQLTLKAFNSIGAVNLENGLELAGINLKKL
jgi:DNA polymerase III, epsilon subunit and related 3''-5'' exonucleases